MITKRIPALAAAVLSLTVAPLPATTVIPEPETTLYGRVLVRSGGSDHQLHAGSLVWTLGGPAVGATTLRTTLTPLDGGRISYKLAIPHDALALDSALSDAVLPLPGGLPDVYDHLEVLVDGVPARVIGDGARPLELIQSKRGATIRADLRVALQLPDSDGDQMPDWWEDLHGLDRQLASDSRDDNDHDGLDNLAEFLAGTDPNTGNDAPQIVSRSIIAYPGGKTGIIIDTFDSDTPASALHYTFLKLPASGSLTLQPSGDPLAAGQTLTQQQLDSGGLVYQADPSSPNPSLTLSVSVSDLDPQHAPDQAEIPIEFFDPAQGDSSDQTSLASRRQTLAGFVQTNALTSWDQLDSPRARPLSLAGSDQPHLITGNGTDDALNGGAAEDILVGGGGDDELRGGDGADRFLYTSPDDGHDSIPDFDPASGDTIDLTRALAGESNLLARYVSVHPSGIHIDTDGDGNGYSDITISLPPDTFAGTSLYQLWLEGTIVAKHLTMRPRLAITASGQASENSSTTATFTVTRTGDTSTTLVVPIHVSGSATNGVDYELLPPAITLPAGQASASVTVSPFPDAVTEGDEIVAVRLGTGEGYELDPALIESRLTISDLMPEVGLEVIRGLADTATGASAIALLTRSGVIDRDVFVRLEIAGTAQPGRIYRTLDPFVDLDPSQTAQPIDIAPILGALAAGSESSVTIRILPDPTYRLSPSSAVTLVLIDSSRSLADLYPGRTPTTEQLLGYAFPSPPSRPSATRTAGGKIRFTFRRRFAATDVAYLPEISFDGRSWLPGDGHLQDVTPAFTTGSAFGEVIYQTIAPAEDSPQLLIRVNVKPATSQRR